MWQWSKRFCTKSIYKLSVIKFINKNLFTKVKSEII